MWLTTGEFIGCMFTLIITESKREYFNDTVDISNIITGLSNMLPLCMFECGCGLWTFFRTVEHGRNLADDSELGILERSQWNRSPPVWFLEVAWASPTASAFLRDGHDVDDTEWFFVPGVDWLEREICWAAHHGFRGQNLQPNDWHGEIPMLGGRPRRG